MADGDAPPPQPRRRHLPPDDEGQPTLGGAIPRPPDRKAPRASLDEAGGNAVRRAEDRANEPTEGNAENGSEDGVADGVADGVEDSEEDSAADGAADDRAEDGAEDWPEGLVAIGGRLDPDTLVRAYRAGIFPWSSHPAVTWWSPDPRAIFPLDTFRPHRSLAKAIRRHGWRYTTDRDFAGVMRGCAEPTADRPSTWISEEFVGAYGELHRRGLAHSLEVWEGDELVGGLYGVTIGGFFGGESMFHRRPDASKAAVAFLVEHLRARSFALLDAQVPTPHLARLGAIEIPRSEYLARLAKALTRPATF